MTDHNAAERETQVREQLGRLNNVVDLLCKQVVDLENRLHIVLRSEDENKSEDLAVGTLVPLAEELMGYTNRVEYAYEMIGRILGRCEL